MRGPLILRLSTNKKSIIATCDDRKWIQTIKEVKLLFDGIPVDFCAFRCVENENKETFDCKKTITLNKDRYRFYAFIDGRRYHGLAYDLRMLIGLQIREVKMAESTKKAAKVRKLNGMVKKR